jgi:nicotinamide-nucleotide amidase
LSPTYEALVEKAAELLAACRARRLTVATAESCTGGLMAAILTEVPGSSDVVERGFVTYSNAAKTELLGVPADLIFRHGAVSEEVARAMALGALEHSRADIGVAVTGVAGPGGGTPSKPAGLVHLVTARRNAPLLHRELRLGDIGRAEVRQASVAEAFELVLALLQERQPRVPETKSNRNPG